MLWGYCRRRRVVSRLIRYFVNKKKGSKITEKRTSDAWECSRAYWAGLALLLLTRRRCSGFIAMGGAKGDRGGDRPCRVVIIY